MFELLKAAFMGAGLVFGSFLIVIMLLRGCVAVVSADEPQRPPPIGTYDADEIYGRRLINPDYSLPPISGEVRPEAEIIIVIPDSGKSYVTCIHDQRYYQYVINRYIQEDPVFWADTIILYQALIEECHL